MAEQRAADEFGRVIEVVDSHTEGEPTRMIPLGGGVPTDGATMAEKRDLLRDRHDEVRRALVREPRGFDAIVLAYVTEPVSADADHGVVFANDVGYLGMCGHGTIGVATTLVRLGVVPATEPSTRVVLDTPVGQVAAEVVVEGGKPRSVRVRNVPSFVLRRDAVVDVPGIGEIRVDVAWGGNWFGFVEAGALGVAVEPGRLSELMRLALAIRDALPDAGVTGIDPASGAAEPVDHLKIWVDETDDEGPAARALTLCPGRAYDRSPCGTGTSAKLALLHARGELDAGRVFRNRSILGTEFRARVLDTVRVGEHAAVVPEIEGSAHITGLHRFVLDPDDPLRDGLPGVG